jgi:hypothetical protein
MTAGAMLPADGQREDDEMTTVPKPPTETGDAQVFRRRSTAIAGAAVAVVVIVLSTLLTVDEWKHGFFAGIAGPVTGITLAILALLLSAWPHVIVRDDYLEPHNSFFWYTVPYPAISDIGPIRMGLVLRTTGRKMIPLTGYATGVGSRLLGHTRAAQTVIEAVEAKMTRRHRSDEEGADIVRHLDRRNVYVMAAAIVVTAVVIVLAAATYS